MTKTSLFVIFSLIFATFPAWTEDWTTTDGKTYKNVTVVSHDATVVTISSSDGMATFPITLLDKNLQKRVQGDDVTAKDWTVDGKDYHNVTVGNVEGDRVHITYDGGVGTVPLADLSPDLQKRFGYNPAQANSAAQNSPPNGQNGQPKLADAAPNSDFTNELRFKTAADSLTGIEALGAEIIHVKTATDPSGTTAKQYIFKLTKDNASCSIQLQTTDKSVVGVYLQRTFDTPNSTPETLKAVTLEVLDTVLAKPHVYETRIIEDYFRCPWATPPATAATLFQHDQLLAYTIWYSNARMRVSGTAYFTLEIVTPNVSVHDDATDDISLVTTDSDAPKSDLSTSLASGGTNYIRWDAKTGKPFLTDSLSESFPDGSHVLDLVGPASDDFIDAMTKWPGLNANTPNSGTAPDPVPVNASFSFRKDNDDPNGPSSSMKSQSAKYGAGLLFSEYNELSFLAWALKETRISYSNIPTFHQIYDPQAQARNAQSWNEDIAAYDDLQKGSTPPTAESLSKRLDDLTEMYGAYRDFRITRKLPPQPDKYGNADIYEVSLYATSTEQYHRDGTRSTTPQPDNGHDEPAYLVTIATSFSSKGSAEVLCTKNSTVSVKDADGFDKTETVYLENTVDPAVENRILDLQKQLHDIHK